MSFRHFSSSQGKIEETHVSDVTFENEYQRYQKHGYAIDCSSNDILGRIQPSKSTHIDSAKPNKAANKKRKAFQAIFEQVFEEGDDIDPSNPWATIKATETRSSTAHTIDEKADEEVKSSSLITDDGVNSSSVHVLEPDEDDEKWEKLNERKMKNILPPRPARGSQANEAKSQFHGDSLVDYQGRSWMSPASGTRSVNSNDLNDHDCFVPKKCIRKFTGHSKGVQEIEFFPGTGHLLLSGSMDGTCKIWDAGTDFAARRTYNGHSEAVRSVHFSNDGHQFLSSGFDRYMRLWDTETGKAVSTLSNRQMAYQVRFYPKDNNLFMAACSNNRIYQWDCRSGQVCQEYNYHLQPCNSVTFIEDGRKFVSTSDDKKVLVWEFDIPVPIKHIAEPDMHSMPSVSVHPSREFFAGQSMDNKIVVYSCGEKIKQLKKKVFQGHNNSGYACQITFSPDGKFLASGDGLGLLHVWDWKSTKSYRRLQAHDGGPCISTAWHPVNPSWIATCGWDGLIKLWD